MLTHSHDFLRAWCRLPGARRSFGDPARRPVVNACRCQQQHRPPRMHPAVKHIAGHEQHHVLRTQRQAPVDDQRDREEHEERRGCERSLEIAARAAPRNSRCSGCAPRRSGDRRRRRAIAAHPHLPSHRRSRRRCRQVGREVLDVRWSAGDCEGGPSAGGRRCTRMNARCTPESRAMRTISGSSDRSTFAENRSASSCAAARSAASNLRSRSSAKTWELICSVAGRHRRAGQCVTSGSSHRRVRSY